MAIPQGKVTSPSNVYNITVLEEQSEVISKWLSLATAMHVGVHLVLKSLLKSASVHLPESLRQVFLHDSPWRSRVSQHIEC